MRLGGIKIYCVQWIVLLFNIYAFNNIPIVESQKKFSTQKLHKTVLKVCKNCDVGPLYNACHVKYCKSIPDSLVFIHTKFSMVFNLKSKTFFDFEP